MKITDTSLLITFMICSNCGNNYSEETNSCPQCGTAVAVEETSAPAQETSAPVNEAAPDKKSKKLVFIIAAVVFALILGIIVTVCVAASSDKGFILYTTEDELFIAHGKSYKPVLAFDDKYELTNLYGISSDGSKFLVEDEDGALYFLDTNSKKAPVKLSSDYSMAVPSEDFKVITYVKDNALYQCNAKGNPVKGEKKIQSKVEEIEVISRDSNIIYYSNMDGDLYVKVGRKDAQLVCLVDDYKTIYGTTDDFKTIYYVTDDGELYAKTIGKDAVKITEDVVSKYGFSSPDSYYTPVTDGTFYVITCEDSVSSGDAVSSDYEPAKSSLCYINGTKCTVVSDDLAIAYSSSFYLSEDGDSGVLAFTSFDSEEYEVYMVVGNKCALWDEDITSIYDVSDDGKYVYYTDHIDENNVGDLYRAKISAKPAKGNLVDEDVRNVRILANGKALYFKDVDEDSHGDLYLDGKFIAENVYTSKVTYHKDSEKFVFFTDYNTEKTRGTLCQYSGKVKTIAEDVYTASYTTDGLVCYMTDYKDGEGTLHVSNKKKAIAEEVTYFLTSLSLER